MANNFGTLNGTVLNTVNMKPETDEQIDALWGQNMADNLAYLWIREQKAWDLMFPSRVKIGANTIAEQFIGTVYWRRPQGHDQVTGTLLSTATGGRLRAWINGEAIVDNNDGDEVTTVHTWDCTGVTPGDIVPVSIKTEWDNAAANRVLLRGWTAWSSYSNWVI